MKATVEIFTAIERFCSVSQSVQVSMLTVGPMFLKFTVQSANRDQYAHCGSNVSQVHSPVSQQRSVCSLWVQCFSSSQSSQPTEISMLTVGPMFLKFTVQSANRDQYALCGSNVSQVHSPVSQQRPVCSDLDKAKIAGRHLKNVVL